MNGGNTHIKGIMAAVPEGPENDQLREHIKAAADYCEQNQMSPQDAEAYCDEAARRMGYMRQAGVYIKPMGNPMQQPGQPPMGQPQGMAPGVQPQPQQPMPPKPPQFGFQANGGTGPVQGQPQTPQTGPQQQPGQFPPKKPEPQQFQRGYSLETEDRNNVEIWSAGTYNGDTYTDADLEAMARSFAELQGEYKPYMKLGHDAGQALLQKDGYPAAGWVTNVRRVGSKLYADIKQIPKRLAELIDAKAYGRFSPEIWWNMKHNGKTYSRVLKAVALLGADVPANPTLADWITLYAQEFTDADLRAYHINEDTIMDATLQKTFDELKAANEKLTAQLAEKEKAYSQVSADLEKVEAEKFAAQVDAAWKSRSGKKILPRLEHAFKAMCYSDRSAEKVYSYNENDAKKELKYSSAFDLACQFVDAMPEIKLQGTLTQYADSSELQKAGIDANDDEALDRQVKAYREKNPAISYVDAVKAITKEAK